MAGSFFRNAYRHLIAARERQAERYVTGALLGMDDKALQQMGVSREELRRKERQHAFF
ncbi:hypothetical protein [Rhizobium cremeum]